MRPVAGWLLPLMGAAIVGAEFRSHKAKVVQKKVECRCSTGSNSTVWGQAASL